MNASEFFTHVVKRNYDEFIKNPDDLRLLWNAVVSMNSVPEYVALDRLRYDPVSRKDLDQASEQVRGSAPILNDLKYCAETFKHVRKIKDHPRLSTPFTTIATSTGISDHDLTTWKIEQYVLVKVLEMAFAALHALPELK